VASGHPYTAPGQIDVAKTATHSRIEVIPRQDRAMRLAFKHILLAAALAVLAGCVSAPSQGPKREAASPAFTEAHQLAQADARGNAARIDALLTSVDDAALSRLTTALAANDPLYPYAGTAMLRRGLAPPHAFDRGWNFEGRAAAAQDGYRPPSKVAVLLPLSGSLSGAAKPVRDGFLAGYYAETRQRPTVTFYDSAGSVGGAYQKAVSEGADYVVGPLDRDQVSALFAQGNLPVPVLALNRGNRVPPPGSVSFSLAPEDEGIAAAEYLFDQGARNVLVLTGPDDTLRRTSAAFREYLQARGGKVIDHLTLGAADALGAQLAAAVAKGPIDAIYFAAHGGQAAAAMPAIAAQPALANARRVGASQIATGAEPAQMRLLDGIVFPSESLGNRPIPGMPDNPGALTPTAAGAAGRLFAFGFDAWLITAYLERLALAPQDPVRGATGNLQLDGFGNVLRTPAWSVMRGGVAMPLGGR